MQKLQAAEMCFWEGCWKSRGLKKATGKYLNMAGVGRHLLETLRKRQLEFFTHVLRRHGLKKVVVSRMIIVEQEALLLQRNRATRYVSWNIMAVFDWAIDKKLC